MEVIKINKERNIGFEIKVIDNILSRQIITLKKDCPTQISTIQVRLLAYMHKKKGKEIYQKDLEKIFDMRRSTISGILKNMEKNNLIKRIESKKDARIKQIITTDYSLKVASHMDEKRREFDKILEKNISKEDLKTFYKVIDQIKENLKDKKSKNFPK